MFFCLLCLLALPNVLHAADVPATPTTPAAPSSRPAFVHPGLLHSREDLEFIRRKVAAGEEPWKSGWEKLRTSPFASLDYRPEPVADVVRGPFNNPDVGSSNLSRDSAAAYCHALQWSVTGDRAHARKAIEVLDAWSSTLKSIGGHDQKLLCGLTGHKFSNAAEILRHTDAGWSDEGVARFKAMLDNVYSPPIRDFLPQANGNWDAAMMHTMLSIAVFNDDRPMFDRAADYYLHGKGHGSIAHYVYPTGQCQESTRDQNHTQLGLGMLAGACQVARTQGVDLFAGEENRLAVGFEYTARYNLGEDVPCQGTISSIGRGRFQPIYEIIYQHYAVEKGMEMPYTKRVVEKVRPEGGGIEQLAWGTLLFYKGGDSNAGAKEGAKNPPAGDGAGKAKPAAR